jgi:hypothetical protein
MACAAAAAITVRAALRIVPRPIRVVTVDGHQLVQEGLAAMINREEDMTVVATASRLRVTYTRGAPWMPASTDTCRRRRPAGNWSKRFARCRQA